jgi:ABC-type transport system involved in cytochrome bd biosynthesis fused ATPase/permease subunit
METASLNGLVKALFIILLVYYGLRFLMRLLAPVIVNEVVKKAEQSFRQQAQDQNPQHTQQDQYKQPEPSAKPQEKKKVGEYIDFEEIE